MADDVHLLGLTGGDYTVFDDACYRAMDWLIRSRTRSRAGCSTRWRTCSNLEVDLIFFNTTSTYFETEDPDPPVWRDGRGRVVHVGEGPDEQPDGEPGAGSGAGSGAAPDGASEGEAGQDAGNPPDGAAGRVG